MALDPVVNFFRSTIATLPVASGGTSIVLQTGDGNKLPNPAVDGAFNLTIYNADDPFVAPEIVRVTARATDTLTVTRAQEGTSATNKTAGSTWNVELTPTAKTIQDIDSTKLNLSGGTMTGDLTIPDKIIHAGDTNTAIRFPSADTVSVETAGVERLRVNSSGNVGIGTTSPTSDITVEKSADKTELRLINTGSASDNKYTALFQGASSTVLPEWDESGVLEATSSGGLYLGAYAGPIRFYTSTIGRTERMRIDSAGNVGIGTSSPATKLDVNGDVTITDKIIHSGDTNTAIRFPSADTVTVETAGSEALRVDSSGNVGIGTTNPAVKLHSVSAVEDDAAWFSDGFNYTLAVRRLTSSIGGMLTGTVGSAVGFGTDNTERMRITSAGNVGIGTASPANPLTVNGIVSASTDNTRTLGTAGLRWSEVFAGNGTINTSDATEKQDVAELDEAEHQVAVALKGLIRKYRWIDAVERKGDDARIHVGVMAQDIAQAFEDAGLDAERYGVFCKDIWYTKEETYTEQVTNPDFDEEAEEGEDNPRMIDGEEQTRTVPCELDDPNATEHVRYGVRYNQLWAFIIAGL